MTEFRHQLKEMVKLGGWVLPGVVFANLTASLPMALVSGYGEGAVSAFGYAYKLHTSILQLFIMALSPLLLAHFSEMIAEGRREEALRLSVRTGWMSMLLGSVVLTLVWLAGSTILELLFSGKFDQSAAKRTARHWLWLSFGLGTALWGNALVKWLQADKGVVWMNSLAAMGILTLVLGVYLMRDWLGEFAVAASMSLSTAIVTLGIWWVVKIRSKRYAR